MRKLILLVVGTLLLSTMMFGASIYQYRDEHNFMWNPDFFYFKVQIFNQTDKPVSITNRDNGGDGVVYTAGKYACGLTVPGNSVQYVDVIWQLRTVLDNDSNHSGFVLNEWRPINDNTYFLSYQACGGRNHKMSFEENHVYHYGPLNMSMRYNGDTLNVYITKAETQNSQPLAQ